ncbi:hypothetical protein ABID58_006821 [Bradyrhizobium sp. S3.2.6]
MPSKLDAHIAIAGRNLSQSLCSALAQEKGFA